jgi:hypothetical protein
MLQKAGSAEIARRPVPPRTRRGLWVLATVDVMAAVWMITAGEWFSTTSTLTSVITLGGHHWVVLTLAGTGFLLLAAMAPMSGGFVEVDRVQAVLIAVAGAVSAAALAGVASIVGLIVGTVLLASLLGKAFVR